MRRLVVLLAIVLSVVCGRAAAATGDRAQYLQLAHDQLTRVGKIWWNPSQRWYTTYPYEPSDGYGGLATVWDFFSILETASLVAIAQPSPANRAAVVRMAVRAEWYWDPGIAGYAYYPGEHRNVNAFFDDNGWLGLAFLEAHHATGDRRFLRDAVRAFDFIDRAGWARDAGGGVWWDLAHEKKTAEPLAAEALMGAVLYERTHEVRYLAVARKMIRWADRHSWNASRRLYQRNEDSAVVMNYVQGMMIGAQAVLCRALHDRSHCKKAEALAAAAQAAFPPDYHWAPETDALYLRWLLELWAVDRDPRWYSVADAQAQLAVANARDASGLFLKAWDGGEASNRLLTPGGTAMLLAALAAAPAPR